jgi:hypothetical protein
MSVFRDYALERMDFATGAPNRSEDASQLVSTTVPEFLITNIGLHEVFRFGSDTHRALFIHER